MVKDDGPLHGRKRALALGAVTVIAVLVAIVASASASPSYSLTPVWLGNANTPTLLPESTPTFGPPYSDEDVVTAMSSDGAATAAWINTNESLSVSSLDPATGIWSLASSPSGAPAEPVTSAYGGPEDAPTVAVAMDAAGDAVVAWYTGTTDQHVDYIDELAGGAWSNPVQLNISVSDRPDVDDVQLAMNSAGDAAIAVSFSNSDPVALTTASAGNSFAFGTPVGLAQPSGGTSAELPQVAVDGAGDVLTTWMESGSANPQPYASFEPSGSVPSPASAVSGGADIGTGFGGPTLAVNSQGDAAIAWPNVSGSGSVVDEADATLGQLETSGGPQFDAAGQVAPNVDAGQPDNSEVYPSIALSDDGTTALAWNDDQTATVDSIVRPAADFGTTDWSSTADMQANSDLCTTSANPCAGPTQNVPPEVAFEQGDSAVVLWSNGVQLASDTSNGVFSVTSQGDSFAGLTGADVHTLEDGSSSSASGDTAWNGTSPSLAGDGVGDAVATWISIDTSGDYQAVEDEMDGAGTTYSIPETATVGTPVTFAGSSPWQWTTPATTWNFGDTTSGSGASVSHTYTSAGTFTVAGQTTDGHGAANDATDTITVSKLGQAIVFAAPAGGTVGGSEALSASGGGSGNPVVFSVDPSSDPSDACSVSGTTVSFANAGSCVVDANQPGNGDYSAAGQVSRTVAVAAAATTPPTTTTPTTTTPATTPPPVLGQSSDVAKTSGTVQVELPGTHTFVTVSSSQQIPFGAIINASGGTVTATVALPNGQTSTATFWAGEFVLSQSKSGAITAKLVGGSYAGCPASSKAARSARASAGAKVAHGKNKKKKPGTTISSLWSTAKGNYTTTGKNGTAAVLGTEWLTRDQCDGTYFEVLKTSNDPHGEIRVTIFHPHRHTVLLKRGHSLLAPAPGFS